MMGDVLLNQSMESIFRSICKVYIKGNRAFIVLPSGEMLLDKYIGMLAKENQVVFVSVVAGDLECME